MTVADDAIGLLAAFAIAWLLFGAPGSVLSIESATRAGAFSTLAGTAAGNVGTLLVAVFLYRARGVGLRGAGLVPVPWSRVVGTALLLAVPLILLSAAHDFVFVELMGRQPRSNAEPILEVLLGPTGGALGLAAVILTVTITAPILEEVVYRGLVYRAFRDRAGVPLAVLASGFVFAVAHLEVDHILPLWWIGMVLALVVERTGSIIPAMGLHALYNSISLGIYLSG
jgi:membrane protease YdiL (CAAX protease family)